MRLILTIIIVTGLALTALIIQKRWKRVRRVSSGLLISYFTILGFLALGEVYFHYFYAESNSVISLASENWMKRYWQVNSLGYRDREWTPADWQGEKTILVTGDSFAAGWGLENPADRFSNVLAAHLGDSYAVMNLGVYGTATPEQLNFLENYPLKKPDVVLMQYCLNDIDYAELRLGIQPKSAPIPDWAHDSYLGNYFFMHYIWNTPLDPGGDRGGWQQLYDLR
jgi:GDSL-like lipase/acylhydrolase family protein